MARVKYHPGIIPLVNQHFGFDFQPHSSGQSITVSKKNDRFRNVNQSSRQQNLMRAIRNWRNMSAETKNAWSVFAATYPQASRRNPAIFLTGYQLFLKRSHYLFLNFGIDTEFMSEPVMVSLPNPVITFSVTQTENCIDVTELYLQAFGVLPIVGSYILLRAFVMARDSGQFFTPIQQVIRVDEVFLDGLFVSIHFAAAVPVVSISLYLSKVNYQSAIYIGTKVRYMGCFSPKTFLELTDTPDSFIGQSEKIVSVKEDETGLEFTEGGGGGIDCDNLLGCGIIQQMLANLANINQYLIDGAGSSIPAVNFGLLYNSLCFTEPISVVGSGWHVSTFAEIETIINSLGGRNLAGGPLKEIGLVWWDSPNTGATNQVGFNSRGGGAISYSNGFFTHLREWNNIWCSDIASSTALWGFRTYYNYVVISWLNLPFNSGASVRLVKDATLLQNGEVGSYTGFDGRVYRTICIEGIEIMADSLCETKLSNGNLIPVAVNHGDWMSLIGAKSAYPDYDSSNV